MDADSVSECLGTNNFPSLFHTHTQFRVKRKKKNRVKTITKQQNKKTKKKNTTNSNYNQNEEKRKKKPGKVIFSFLLQKSLLFQFYYYSLHFRFFEHIYDIHYEGAANQKIMLGPGIRQTILSARLFLPNNKNRNKEQVTVNKRG